jgi:hypothetical protein
MKSPPSRSTRKKRRNSHPRRGQDTHSAAIGMYTTSSMDRRRLPMV